MPELGCRRFGGAQVPSLICQNQGPGPRAGECGGCLRLRLAAMMMLVVRSMVMPLTMM